MLRIRIFAVPLLILFLLGSVMSSSAAAAKKKGEVVNRKGETVKGKATGKSASSLVIETLAGVKLTCSSGESSGEATSTMNGVSSKSVLKGCKKSTGGTCHSKGAAAEEVVVGEVAGEVVRSPNEEKDLGLATIPTEFTFECAEVKIAVEKGSQGLASGSPEETFTTEAKSTVKCVGVGKPEFTKYKILNGEEKTIHPLRIKIGAGSFEEACESGSGVGTSAEEAEAI